jgi:hypothetical protein
MPHKVVLTNQFSRERFKRIVDQAPEGYVAEVREPKRTLDQNSRLWAMLTDVALSKPLGRHHTPEEWKCIFMSAAGWEVAFLPGLDGRFLPYGYRSSQLTKKQMTDLQDFIQAWGDENGVKWSQQEAA